MHRPIVAASYTLLLLLTSLAPAHAAHHHTRTEKVTAHWTAADQTSVFGNTPRGYTVLTQTGRKPYGLDPIVGRVHVVGLKPNTQYVTVLYKDPVCAPTPGVTAFPSTPFTTDAQGAADVPIKVNPQAINPVARDNIASTLSVSIRRTLLPGQPLPVTVPVGPITLPILGTVTPPTSTPTVPLVVTEACDPHPTVKRIR